MKISPWGTVFASVLTVSLLLAATVRHPWSFLFAGLGFCAWATVGWIIHVQAFEAGRKSAYDEAAALDDALNYGRDR